MYTVTVSNVSSYPNPQKQMFSLFFVVFCLPPLLFGGKKKHGVSNAAKSDLVLVENCQRFLDACVRRNTAEVPKIQVKQHLRLVKHTPQESLGERVKGGYPSYVRTINPRTWKYFLTLAT